MSALLAEKNALRALARERLKALNETSRREQSASACSRLMELKAYKDARTVLIYNAMPVECDPRQIASCAKAEGKRVLYPLCTENNSLLLYEPTHENAFKRGPFNILEPDPALSTLVSPSEVDFIAVPGLAFSKDGGRLGRGAGYYDRLLIQTNAFKAGFCFFEQLFEHVPMEAFDIKMDCVVAGNCIYCE